MLTGGHWSQAVSGRTSPSLNPYSQEPWAIVPEAGTADAQLAIAAAREAFDHGPWSRTTAWQRGLDAQVG
jgi:acyl-CoA reductase-like NAD-dependent aldehyde dehydrogenase